MTTHSTHLKLSKDEARRQIVEYFKACNPIIKDVAAGREEWVNELAVVSELLRKGQTGQGFRHAAEMGRQYRFRFEGAGQTLDGLVPPTPATEQCHKLLRTWVEWQVRANATLAQLAQTSDATRLSECRGQLEKARVTAVAFSKTKDHLFAQYGIGYKAKPSG